jgi:hypothetical protein
VISIGAVFDKLVVCTLGPEGAASPIYSQTRHYVGFLQRRGSSSFTGHKGLAENAAQLPKQASRPWTGTRRSPAAAIEPTTCSQLPVKSGPGAALSTT